ncbi:MULTISPECIES: DUF4446 family protein [Brevibacillus]|jgi:hypothetical protein|uniref:DUF4446 domain-containing protein n=1 Tax=Brevibacillus borstelensis AK1 TaxID=1300222 RepID=M8DM63_9BACL|nr:DUF4446 family protein [Brevibacillus borstelensis]EMT54547.1 hypothetical protein I532_03045 [Brevibacillus borstelensis AK1]KKX54351.1 hypothetical protein X546_15085 [Brevibacillus borstelensis cifa_chp40]MBE5395944.1 DUF4446 family protein [Brevibacillus borstelensis]MCC0563234.1 DUF4446 family protein [Brevibacillus borstelensis]MCM3471293.1 DUF4446 family protein [Brevibacillus borstelensis]
MVDLLSLAENTPFLLLATLGLILLLFLLLIMQSVRINRLRKSLNRLLSGTNGANLEEGMHRLFDEMDDVKKRQTDQQFLLNRLSQRIAGQCGNVGVVRYNAFDDIGNDLSFSLAIIDDSQNGVVVTSIFSRMESRVYAKPVEQGSSPYHLSEEEQTAIRKAMNQIAGSPSGTEIKQEN